MDFNALKEQVFRANLALVEHGLVLLTWGNASAIDRAAGVVAIKPSGVEYASMRPEDIVVVDMEGRPFTQSGMRPSSDLPTHLALYRAFPKAGAIVHTHSTWATVWAQAGMDIPCYGTTHADHFYGAVPCTDAMEETEIAGAYEHNTGEVIIRRMQGMDAAQMPAALVHGHGPFAWGANAQEAVENAVVLEEVARMAHLTRTLSPAAQPIGQPLLNRHFLRKHGANAYYGQTKEDKR